MCLDRKDMYMLDARDCSLTVSEGSRMQTSVIGDDVTERLTDASLRSGLPASQVSAFTAACIRLGRVV